MKDSSELFDLVKLLSMSEKRYVSLQAKSYKDNSANYKLFRALDSMKVYDLEQIKKIFGKNGSFNNIAVLKLNLQKFIMKCLRNFYSGTDEDMVMYEMLAEIAVMFRKKNVTEVQRLIKRLERFAMQRDNYDILNICYKYERKLSMQRLTVKTSKELESFNKKYNDTLEKLHVENMYSHLSNMLHEFYLSRGTLRKKSEENYVKRFLKNPYLRSQKYLITTVATVRHHNMRGLCYMLLQQNDKAMVEVDKELAILKAAIAKDPAKFKRYLEVYGNKIALNEGVSKYKEAIEVIHELRQMPAKAIKEKWMDEIPREIRINLEVDCNNSEAAICVITANYERALITYTRVENLVENIKNYEMDAADMEFYTYYTAYMHYILGNNKQALAYLQKVIKYGTNDPILRGDIYAYAKILQLVIYFEMGDEKFSAYLLRSTYRFFAKRKRLYPIDEALLSFMRYQLLGSPNPNLFQENLLKLRKRIEKITHKKLEGKALMYFDFLAWIESKLQKRPFIEVMKRKYYIALPG